MTKARDISGLANGVPNSLINLDSAEIPNLDASKITTGELANARVADLPASKITTGTFADARIASSNVSQHATTFDDSKIQQDLMVLALQQATDANKSAYSLSNSFIEQFEDSTGIDVLTSVSRNASEYVSSFTESSYADGATTFVDSSSYNRTLTRNGSITHSTLQAKFGTSSIYFGADPTSSPRYVSSADSDSYTLGTGNWTIEFWTYGSQTGGNINADHQPLVGWNTHVYSPFQIATKTNAGSTISWYGSSDSANWDIAANQDLGTVDSSWRHIALVREGNTFSGYNNGTRTSTFSSSSAMVNPSDGLTIGRFQGADIYPRGFIDNIRLSNVARYTASSSSLTMPTTQFISDANTLYLLKSQILIVNATGNFTSVSKTAPATVSKMGIVVLYKNNSGTATLNTDLIAQVSANNGTDFTTVTLTPRGTFSTGINIAVANNVTVTSGTSCKYKISFANQSSGVKETQVHGIGLLY
jgi:hypothetical protein